MKKFLIFLGVLIVMLALTFALEPLFSGKPLTIQAIVLLALLVGGLVTGSLSAMLADKKGYRGYFWTGFLLGISGLIYVAGLPVSARVTATEPEAKRKEFSA